jgi:SAM-dependent methyltransferase
VTFPLDAETDRTEAARWAYRLLLDRDPENEEVVQQLVRGDTRTLRQVVMESAEYRNRNPSAPGPSKPTIVQVHAPPNRVDVHVSGELAKALRAHVQATWTRLGNEAPHWSVLSGDQFLPDKISQTEGMFYNSGIQDLNWTIGILARHGIAPSKLPVCFEFGCGLGRVTLPLATTFKQVNACDISTSHLEVAIRRAETAKVHNISFLHADTNDFGMVDAFDFWFSRIVLQHNPPPIMHAILKRAFSLLRKNGVAVFQVPTYATGYSFDIRRYSLDMAASDGIEMHCLPQSHIFELAYQNNMRVLEVREDFSAGPPEHWVSNVFILQKAG